MAIYHTFPGKTVPPAQGILATATVALTTIVLYHAPARLFFDTSLQTVRPYGLAYIAAVALLTWLGGRPLGLLTLTMAVVGAMYLLPPRSTLAVGDLCGWAELGGLLLIGVPAVCGVDLLRRPASPTFAAAQPGNDGGKTGALPQAGEDWKELSVWWREVNGSSRQWLILGKGPSYQARDQYDLRPYTTIAINHVVREMPVDVVSVVNHEVLRDCSDDIYRNARFLLAPRYPCSVRGEIGQPLESYFETNPALEAMRREGRVVWYNLSTGPAIPHAPQIRNGLFSVCILFNLLGAMGVRRVRTLGVDGGTSYAASFGDIAGRTKLASGLPTYDLQFIDMIDSIQRFRLDWAPLTRLPLRVRVKMSLYRVRHALRPWYRRYLKARLEGPSAEG